MKNLIVLGGIVGIFFFSCKKDTRQLNKLYPAKVKKYAVKFNASAFSQSNGTISLNSTTGTSQVQHINDVSDTSSLASAGINEYYYIVYDSSGKEADRILRYIQSGIMHQDNYFTNGVFTTTGYPHGETITGPFDTITDSLAAGTYTIVMLGAVINFNFNQDIFIDTNDEDIQKARTAPLSTAYFNYVWGLDPDPNTVDTYLYKGSLTVANQDVTQNYTLNRITAQLEVNIEDALPSDAKFITVAFYEECMGLTLNDLQPNQFDFEGPGGYNFTIDPGMYGQTNTQYISNVINTATPMNVSIYCYDAANNLLATKVINNLQFVKNEKMILTGKLFDNVKPLVVQSAGSQGPKITTVHF